MNCRGLVAIVGRPNVGKSTLFNRLTHTNTSIVNDRPGVTRDRIYGTAFYDKAKTDAFRLIDTGGFERHDYNFQPFSEPLVWRQTELAIAEADVVLLVLDGKHGIHQHDRMLIDFLRSIEKPVLYLVNKIDGKEQESLSFEFYSLGIKKLFPISAAHLKGMTDVLSAIKNELKSMGPRGITVTKGNTGHRISIIGRPNAGKSSIVNRLLGQERAVVSPVAGTTRDSLDTPFVYNKQDYVLVDTAGIRRRKSVTDDVEVVSVMRSLRAIDNADIVVMVIDALEGLTDQDTRLIHIALENYKPILLVVNKWDLIPDKDTKTAQNYLRNIRDNVLRDLHYIPLHFVSCLENQRIHKIMDRIEKLIAQSSHRAPTSKINECLAKMVAENTPHLIRHNTRRLKFYYTTQISCSPPTIAVTCNYASEIHESYRRYMVKRFRAELGFYDVPLKLVLRGKDSNKKQRRPELGDDEQAACINE